MLPLSLLSGWSVFRVAGLAAAVLVLGAGVFWAGYRWGAAIYQRQIVQLSEQLAQSVTEAAQNRLAIETLKRESDRRSKIAQEAIKQASEYRRKAEERKSNLEKISLPSEECSALRVLIDVHRGQQ